MAHEPITAGSGLPLVLPVGESDGLGARLRSARRRARLSTRELAERAGVSAGFVSQVETGKRGVSVSALKRLADAVGLSAAELLAERPPVARQVLRSHERPVFESETGLTKLLLSRTPLQQLEVYVGRFSVGGSTGVEPYSHDDAQEMFHVVSGHVEFTVGGDAFVLGPGDTLEYLSAVPHRAVNVGAAEAEAFWITSHFSPPVDPNPASARPSTSQHANPHAGPPTNPHAGLHTGQPRPHHRSPEGRQP